MSKPLFNAKINLISSASTIDPLEFIISISVIDQEGVFSGLDIVIGDTLYLDTSSIELATITKYSVISIVSAAFLNASLRIRFVDDNTTTIDPSVAIGVDGFISRSTVGSYAVVPAPGTQLLPDKFSIYPTNSNFKTLGSISQGATGVQGEIGATGVQGFQGVTGIQGIQGIQGFIGATGVGAQGIQGTQGNTGIIGVGLNSRTTISATTSSLVNGATGDLSITGYKGYFIYKIQTSGACWVRLYTSTTARTNDSSRLEGNDPTYGSGVIAEVITTGAETILVSPATIGFTEDASTSLPLAVTNKSGATNAFTITLTVVNFEV